MTEFKSICAADKERFDFYRKKDVTQASEGVFATMYIWNDYYNLKIAENGEFLFLRFEIKGKEPSYFFPIGNGDLKKAVEELEEICRKNGERLIFRLVEEKNTEKLKALFPDKFDFVYDRDCSDYVYPAEKLISLSGKKLHGKKNHLNYFMKNYEYSYKNVTSAELLEECRKKAISMIEAKTKNKNPYEKGAMEKYFAHFFDFGQKGAVLLVDGKICAMTFGERLTEDTALVQIELADEDVRGAYQMINKLFCENEWKDCKYINREEDMGIEGLRKAKESYQPIFMMNKYKVIEKE